MPNVSDFYLDNKTGKAFFEFDTGLNSQLDLSSLIVSQSTGLDATQYDLFPDTGLDITSKLQAALTAGRVLNKPVVLKPGKYIYSGIIDYAGGGLVCYGEAWLDAQDPSYNAHAIKFRSTDSSYLDGIEVKGIKFTCSTRPDTGLANDAPEGAGFIHAIKCRNVKVWGNKFNHNYGGAVLFRDVEDSSIIGNEVTDVWKDAFHITDSSRNIVRAFNIVRGGGDDAFAVVGYVAKGVMPIGITDIGNRVYCVRTGRAFAYVGCKDVENIGCYVDGKLPSIIPQQTNTDIAKYNTSCGLYIGSEGGFNTYGCENVRVTGLILENLGPSIDLAGNPVAGIGTYQQIHINAGNGSGNPHKNLKISATCRNGTSRGFFIIGNTWVQDVEADIVVEDNTDPNGILSLTNTPGGGNQHAAELQGARNVRLKLRANKIGKGAVWVTNTCEGSLDLDVSVGSLSQTTAGQSVITLVSTTNLDRVDIKLNFETTPAASGLGSIGRFVDNSGNNGVIRSCKVTGVNHATAATNALNGWPARTLTAGTSPTAIINTSQSNKLIRVYGGTVSAIGRAAIKGRVTAKAVVTGANGTVQFDGDLTDVYAASSVVTFFNAKGVQFATGTVASSAVSGGVTTVTFDATGVNASFAVGMQMGILNTFKTIYGRTNGMVELPPEHAVQITYSVAPTINIMEEAY